MDNHVFVTRGDITKLRCSAWLLPTDLMFTMSPQWVNGAPDRARVEFDELRTGRSSHRWDGRCVVIEPWYSGSGDAPAPIPILTNTGGSSATELGWYLDGVEAFIQQAMKSIAYQSPIWRERPLLALPLIASGLGGWSQKKGALAAEIMKTVLETLVAGNHKADVALVLRHDAAYAAAQANRSPEAWPVVLNGELRKKADALADLARCDQLVLFLGAGIGKPAGLPLWNQLITDLATEFELNSEEQQELEKLPVLDGASVVESRSPSPKAFRETIARRFCGVLYGLPHALLGSLKIREAVTTNYDSLYEAACNDAGNKLSKLPYEPSPEAQSWLLKLHGSVEHPEDIVITRRDYLRYQNNRAALYGIVQAMLITRHILFLGFSLTDDNFHAVIDEVRRAIDGDESSTKMRKQFGTAVTQRSSLLSKDLWNADLDIVQMATHAPDDRSAARLTEIFLDYLAYKSLMPIDHFFDPTYEEALTLPDRRIKEALVHLKTALGDDLLEEHASPIIKLLSLYGFR